MSVPPRERKCAQTILRKPLLLASCRLFQSRRSQPSPKPAWLHFPEVSFDFREGHSAELLDMLSKGRLDLAFAYALSDVDDPRQARLMQEPYMLACHVDHPFARRGSISLSEIDGENFVLRTSCEARRATQDILSARGIRTHRARRPCSQSCRIRHRHRPDASRVLRSGGRACAT